MAQTDSHFRNGRNQSKLISLSEFQERKTFTVLLKLVSSAEHFELLMDI